MTKEEFMKLPPVVIDSEGGLVGLVFIGKGNVYASMPDAHGDNFLISTGIREDGTFNLDVEGTDWVEVSEGLGEKGELI